MTTSTKAKPSTEARVRAAAARFRAEADVRAAKAALTEAEAYLSRVTAEREVAHSRRLALAIRVGVGEHPALAEAREAVSSLSGLVEEAEALVAARSASLSSAEEALTETDGESVGIVRVLRADAVAAAAAVDAANAGLVAATTRLIEALGRAAPLGDGVGPGVPPVTRLRAAGWLEGWLKALPWRVDRRWGEPVPHAWRSMSVRSYVDRMWADNEMATKEEG